MDKLTLLTNMEPATVFIAKIFKDACIEHAQKIPEWIHNKLKVTDPFKSDARKYVANICERYNSMKIIGMEKPVSLDDIYINVYVIDDFDDNFYRKQYEGREASIFSNENKPSISANYIISNNSKVMLLGRPGAGKTTYLKYLAITCLNKKLKIDLIPIVISLKNWSQKSTVKLETEIIKQFDVCDLKQPKEFVKRLLRKGRCMILLDGFDEIEERFREKAISQIECLTKDYPKNKFVLSCRTAANSFVFEGFTEVEVADFNIEQIKAFIRKWFDQARDANRCIDELMKSDNAGIRELSSNPLLLTLICIAYKESFSFPENRVELYEIALEALLKKWDISRNIKRYNPYKKLTLRFKELLLCKIAATGFEKNEELYTLKGTSELINEFLNEYVKDKEYDNDPEGILLAIESQHGIINKIGSNEFTFSHLTFKEYFTAKFISEHQDKQLINKVIEKHLGDPRWNEIFLIYSGLQKNASIYLNILKNSVDVLRNTSVSEILNFAESQIRFKGSYTQLTCTILALYQVLSFNENDEIAEYDYKSNNLYLGKQESVASIVKLVARSIMSVLNIHKSITDASLSVCSLGNFNRRKKFKKAIQDNSFCEEELDSLQRFLFGIYIITSCLSGEALIHNDFKNDMLQMLLKDGTPQLKNFNSDLLLS